MSAPTRFKASCPDCRRSSELDPGAFRLTVGRSSEHTFYSFACPHCGAAVRKRAGERIVDALTAAGVITMRLHLGLSEQRGLTEQRGLPERVGQAEWVGRSAQQRTTVP